MTSRVARSSSAAIRSAVTGRRRGAVAFGVVELSDLATRSPRSDPVASMMMTSESRSDDFVLAASAMGRTMMIPRKTGPRIVATMNHFERTRSRYSRLNTTQALPMAGHSLLDSTRPDALQENLMQ